MSGPSAPVVIHCDAEDCESRTAYWPTEAVLPHGWINTARVMLGDGAAKVVSPWVYLCPHHAQIENDAD